MRKWNLGVLLFLGFLLPACAPSGASGRQPKMYMGRTIAPVMGHDGASWLERRERDKEERPDLLLQALALRPTDRVADFGAGTGYFTFRLAPLVPQGEVVAVDIQPEMLDEIRHVQRATEQHNIQTVLGEECDPKLPAGSLDLILLVDVYHELACPREIATALARSLKPGGRIALVEYRAEDPAVPIKPLHKMTEAQARREWEAVPGLRWVETKKMLPRQHLLLFEKVS